MADKQSSGEAARSARLIARGALSGALATVRKGKDAGRPYVSKVGLALDIDGSPLFLFSTLAAHTQDVMADSRASLLVEAPSPENTPNPLQVGRATLVGQLEQLPAPTDDYERARYLVRHPSAAQYAGFGDFSMWRMNVEKVHYVGGFGRAKWAKADNYLTPNPWLKACEVQLMADLGGVAQKILQIDGDGVTVAGSDETEFRQNFSAPAKDIEDWRTHFDRLFHA